MQRSALCRSRRVLSNPYLLAKSRFDTAENERAAARRMCPWQKKKHADRDLSAEVEIDPGSPKFGTERLPTGCGKLYRARSRLYRNEFLQVNMPLKALAEICTMHSFALL